MAEGYETLLTPDDDNFHTGHGPWFTEGSWWCFFAPEERLGGWIYHLTRRNSGSAVGGVWVWDDRSVSCFEAPYFLYHTAQILPPGPHDLNDFTWPDGVHLTTLEPLSAYRLTYADRDVISLDLEYRGVSPPYVSVSGDPPAPFRFEQVCRVTGSLTLAGRTRDISCLAVRDHSWGQRPERSLSVEPHAAVDAGQFAQRPVVYLFANASPAEGFFVMGAGGYLMRDGLRVDLVSVTQDVTRDPGSGLITRIAIDTKDTRGRELHAEGRPLSCITRPSNSGVGMVYLTEWRFGAFTGYGELQDVWPVDVWARYRRGASGAL